MNPPSLIVGTCRRVLWLAACILAVLPYRTMASPEPFLGTAYTQEPWTFLPAVGSEPQKIGAILAVKDPDTLVGDNIGVVLFIRADDEWTGWAWFAESIPNAIGAAVTSLNPNADADETIDFISSVEIEVDYATFDARDPSAKRSLMGVGVLADDPLSEQTADGYEGVLLSHSLTRDGHRAADLDIDLSPMGREEAIPIGTFLDAIAKGSEFALVHPTASNEEAAMAMFRAIGELNPQRRDQVQDASEDHSRIHLIRVGNEVWMLGECWFEHYLLRARSAVAGSS